MAKVQCPGSNQVVAEEDITEMPDLTDDGYGNLTGFAGKANCTTCGRNVGLQTPYTATGSDIPRPDWGRMSRHTRPEEQVQPEYVEPEEEAEPEV